ncbi:NAD(P)-binding protein [Sulfitobacter sp. TSTF-M16]|uniref:NAD(P)-binding protein n=1 Tax=Sulfitobacter aestuariivivens TaxID=2766981 RepID=A0A927HFT6_9RHOB|nr:NAD(P)-binding protein [Sulfitobacter aestuariivivens]MBD3664764.1 NAD(P)-binding protein [Sulfitobacter aestuariivivens]
MDRFETDYLIIGAGASGLSFADTLLDETDAHITLVDRRDKAGGHWNDAYPFVRLHQPSSYYGVASRDLGRGAIDTSGLNKGFEELASGLEVAAYFHAVMQDRLLQSGRVRFLPMSEHLGDGEVRHLLSGKATQIDVRHRLVNAGLLENGIPLTHERRFRVADDVVCIPPNALPHMARLHDQFTVLGAGKTAMDSVLWLLESGADASQIRWVVPRDPWMINRVFSQPSGAFYHESFGGTMRQMEAVMDATSVDDLADRMEAANLWMRLDPSVRPVIMHGPTVSMAELGRLREVRDIVRLGHVESIEPGAMNLVGGTCPARPKTLYIDCTARALGHTDTWPVFQEDQIVLQMIRLYQPTFSAALIAKIETSFDTIKEKNALAAPVPMTDTVQTWVVSQLVNATNQFAWSQHPDIKNWITHCRLDGFGRASREVDRTDPTIKKIYDRIKEVSFPAFANMQKLATA